jgi:hypothetical protein
MRIYIIYKSDWKRKRTFKYSILIEESYINWSVCSLLLGLSGKLSDFEASVLSVDHDLESIEVSQAISLGSVH